MDFKIVWFFTCYLLLAFDLRITLAGMCNQCQANNVACRDEVQFSVCFKGNISETTIPCPPGHVCTSDDRICLPKSTGGQPSCVNHCGDCASSNETFVCLDETSYAFCYGDNMQNRTTIDIKPCPEGFICSTDGRSQEVCKEQSMTEPSCRPYHNGESYGGISTENRLDSMPTTYTTGVGLIKDNGSGEGSTEKLGNGGSTEDPANVRSTKYDHEIHMSTKDLKTSESTKAPHNYPSTEFENKATTATTPNPAPFDPVEFCSSTKRQGRFAVDGDTTGREYIFCYLLAGEYLGYKQSCYFYFNAALGECQKMPKINDF